MQHPGQIRSGALRFARMASKPFNPFDDDDLEFQPPGATSLTEPAAPVTQVRKIVERTAVTEAPKREGRPLRLTFEELNDQGGDIRGAKAVGAENLASDEFLTGVKRQDYAEALQRAKAAQLSLPVGSVQETRVGRKVNTPIYVTILGCVLFVALLVGGGFAFKAYTEYAERARLQELQAVQPQPPSR
jgi:hypothetical protein